MNIGIIVYSQTGNTYSVALRLREKLVAAGHAVALERIEVMGEAAPGKPVQFKTLPEVGPYDALVFGAPVHAFSLCLPMLGYLKQVTSLQGKKVACLVTQGFPWAWMGGNRAIRQMEGLCQAKGAMVCGAGVVNWMNKNRERQIGEVVDRLSGLF